MCTAVLNVGPRRPALGGFVENTGRRRVVLLDPTVNMTPTALSSGQCSSLTYLTRPLFLFKTLVYKYSCLNFFYKGSMHMINEQSESTEGLLTAKLKSWPLLSPFLTCCPQATVAVSVVAFCFGVFFSLSSPQL